MKWFTCYPPLPATCYLLKKRQKHQGQQEKLCLHSKLQFQIKSIITLAMYWCFVIFQHFARKDLSKAHNNLLFSWWAIGNQYCIYKLLKSFNNYKNFHSIHFIFQHICQFLPFFQLKAVCLSGVGIFVLSFMSIERTSWKYCWNTKNRHSSFLNFHIWHKPQQNIDIICH